MLWAVDKDPRSPRGPLSPGGPLSPSSSDCSRGSGGFGSPLSFFTVKHSQVAAPGAALVELEEGEITPAVADAARGADATAALLRETDVAMGVVATATSMCDASPQCVASLVVDSLLEPDVASPHSTALLVAAPVSRGQASSATSADLDMRLASFCDRCRQQRAALLPKSATKRPHKKRASPSVVRRSRRVAGRFAVGTPIKQQQKFLMLQLGIARKGEVIGDEALQAYLSYFKKPMSEGDLTACLALFGWLPSALPLAVEEDLVV